VKEPLIPALKKLSRNNTSEHTPKNNTNNEQPFDVFWKAYPGKKGGGKEKLRKKWKLDKLDSKAEHIMAILEAMKRTEQWTKEKGQFIPMMSTWLNQQRWDDEIPDSGLVVGKIGSKNSTFFERTGLPT